MKLDVQHAGRPFLRLHDFDQEELRRFRERVAGLAAGVCQAVPLHEEPYIQPPNGCHLTLRVGAVDLGIEHTVVCRLSCGDATAEWPDSYVCELTREGWLRVGWGIDLLLPSRFLCGEYVWLHKQWEGHGAVAWLLSPTGEW